MAIKYYDTASHEWKDYTGEITQGTVGRIFINGKWKLAWRSSEEQYIELSFLQGNGLSWIETGLYGDNTSDLEIAVNSGTDVVRPSCICGARSSATQNNLSMAEGTTGVGFHVDFADYQSSRASVTHQFNVKYILRDKYDLRSISTESSIIARNTNVIRTVFTTPETLGLFYVKGYAVSDLYNGKVYYYKHSKNGVLLQNMIPAKRVSDGKIGMYDTINKEFFTSATSTDFSQGTASEIGIIT